MLYSVAKKFIYSQAPRSASTSTALALRPHCCPPGTVFSKGAMTEMITDYGIVSATGPAGKTDRFFTHMPAALIRQSLPPEVWDGCTKIANVRNPFSRMLSIYSRILRIGRAGPFATVAEIRDAFGAWVLSLRNEDLYRSIFHLGTDAGTGIVIDEFVYFEDLGPQIDALCRKLGLVQTHAFPHVQESNQQLFGLPAVEFYIEVSRAKVLRDYAWVFDHFGYSTDPREAKALPAIAVQTEGNATHAAAQGQA